MELQRENINRIVSKPQFRLQLENELRRMEERSEEERTKFMARVYNRIRKSKLCSLAKVDITFEVMDDIRKQVAAEPLRKPEALDDFPFTVAQTVAENFQLWTLSELHSAHVIDYMESTQMILENMFQIYAYNERGERLYFIKPLSIAEKQYVYLAYHFSAADQVLSTEELQGLVEVWDNRKAVPVENLARYKVIKWGDRVSEKDDVEDELKIWDECKKLGIPHPCVDGSFKFCDATVMVMDPLRPIDPDVDDYRKVGAAIVQILEKFHTFGCHSDIKPDNIMASLGPDPTYYLIDMGGVTTEKYEYGYKRKIWSPLYASQVYEKNQVTTAKYDLLELGYTLGIYKRRPKNHETCRVSYPEEIDGYFQMVKQYSDGNIPRSIYFDLSQYLLCF